MRATPAVTPRFNCFVIGIAIAAQHVHLELASETVSYGQLHRHGIWSNGRRAPKTSTTSQTLQPTETMCAPVRSCSLPLSSRSVTPPTPPPLHIVLTPALQPEPSHRPHPISKPSRNTSLLRPPATEPTLLPPPYLTPLLPSTHPCPAPLLTPLQPFSLLALCPSSHLPAVHLHHPSSSRLFAKFWLNQAAAQSCMIFWQRSRSCSLCLLDPARSGLCLSPVLQLLSTVRTLPLCAGSRRQRLAVFRPAALPVFRCLHLAPTPPFNTHLTESFLSVFSNHSVIFSW